MLRYLPGLDQRSSAVHVVLRVHDKHHLVSVEFKATVQAAGVLHAQLAVPLSPAAHGLHLPHLPAPEAPQVPTSTDTLQTLITSGNFSLNCDVVKLETLLNFTEVDESGAGTA